MALARTVREQVPTLVHAFRGRLSIAQALSLVLEAIEANAPRSLNGALGPVPLRSSMALLTGA